jgi:hypothetical protein
LFALSQVIGEEVSMEMFAPLPETDELRNTFRTGYRVAVSGGLGYRRVFSLSQKNSVLNLADCLAERVAGETVFFLTKVSEYCGAVRLNFSTLLRHTASIIGLDGDSLSALSLDGTEGVLIDFNGDDQEEGYEIAVWGDRWPLSILACEGRQSAR